jgi:hypothetical protein
MRIEDLPLKYQGRIEKQGDCWMWTGSRRNEYGVIYIGPKSIVNGKQHGSITRYAHREIKQIAEGRQLGPKGTEDCDHLCPNKLCVNPAHVELKSASEHMRRHHPKHAFTPEERAERKAKAKQVLAKWKLDNPYRWRSIQRKGEQKKQETKRFNRLRNLLASPISDNAIQRYVEETSRYRNTHRKPKLLRIYSTEEFYNWWSKRG